MSAEANSEAKVNRELVRLLESALTDAKVGRIAAGGVVCVVGPSSAIAFSAMGVYPYEVIGAAEVMKADVILKMRQAQQGRILRPAGPTGPRLDG
jgi:hypothetical protein